MENLAAGPEERQTRIAEFEAAGDSTSAEAATEAEIQALEALPRVGWEGVEDRFGPSDLRSGFECVSPASQLVEVAVGNHREPEPGRSIGALGEASFIGQGGEALRLEVGGIEIEFETTEGRQRQEGGHGRGDTPTTARLAS